MVRKTGVFGQNAETIINSMVATMPTGNAYVLLHFNDETKKMDGFIFAFYSEPAKYVEFIGMWTAPGVASRVKNEANLLFEDWCRKKGAARIMIGILNRRKRQNEARKFLKWFHEPLGYEEIGIIACKELEVEKNEEEKDGV